MKPSFGYRAATWRPESGLRRVWALARHEALSLFRTRAGVLTFLFCLVPGLLRLVMLLIIFGVVQFGPMALRNRLNNRGPELGRLDPRNIDFYVEPVLQPLPGLLCVLLLTSMVLARTIARDRATNALELYWTRGISPLGYLCGKWLGGALPLSALTMLTPLLLWLTAVLLAPDWTLLADSWHRMLQAQVGLLIITVAWSGLPILISAVASSANGAMVAWIALMVGTKALATVMAALLRLPELPSYLSVWDAGGTIVRTCAGIPDRYGQPLWSAMLLAGVAAVLWLRAQRRLRLVEAVT